MKTKILAILALAALVACSPEPFKEPSGSYDLNKGIDGSWLLTKVELEDRSFPAFETKDVTEFFDGQTVSISFDASTESYLVDGGTAGHPFGSGGFYSFNDPNYPTQITITPSDADLDEVTLDLGNMVRSIDQQMELVNTRSSCEKVYALYIYSFNRVNAQ